jgi:hypothetical protein
MTPWKIFANDIFLGQICEKYVDFVELVAHQDVRLEWPDAEEAPHLLDSIWNLAKTCWVKDPKQRPTTSDVCDILSNYSILLPTLLHTQFCSPIPPIHW